MSKEIASKQTGRLVLLYFVLFFATVSCVDAFMINMALRTKSGVVADNSFMKGLNYNETLDKAASQQKMNVNSTADYKDGQITWRLLRNGMPVTNATIKATAFRDVKEGYDFSVTYKETEPGVYIAKPSFPLQGAWTIKMEATWITHPDQKQIYRESLDLITAR